MTARTVPVLRNWVAGETDTGAYMQTNVKQAGDFLLGRPFVSLRSTVGVTMTNAGTTYMIPFDTEDADTDGFHDPVTLNTRITVPAGLSGWYDVKALAECIPTSGQRFLIWPYINGAATDIWQGEYAGGASAIGLGVARSYYLNAGDYLEVGVQCSLAGKTVPANTASLQAIWISR